MRYQLIISLILIFSSINLFAQKKELVNIEVDSLEGIYIPKSLEDCYFELDKLLLDLEWQEFAEMGEDEAVGMSHFGLGNWLRNNWGLWSGTRLTLYFNELGIFHPDDMSGIILTSYHRYLNHKNINIESQIKYYQDFWIKLEIKEQEQEDIASAEAGKSHYWLKKEGVLLNRLPKAKPSEIIYRCDSTLLLKRVSGDTTIIWTEGSESYLDTTRIKKLIDSDRFGLTSYIKEVNYQGKITYVSLSPKTFYVRNDSLFELEVFYKISQDSFSRLYDQLFKVEPNDTLSRMKIMNLIDESKYQEFKLIFHPDLFERNDIYTENINKDRIELISFWKLKNKRYYEIEIRNNIGKYASKYVYLFDDKYKLLKYDGCNEAEISELTEENRRKNNH